MKNYGEMGRIYGYSYIYNSVSSLKNSTSELNTAGKQC